MHDVEVGKDKHDEQAFEEAAFRVRAGQRCSRVEAR